MSKKEVLIMPAIMSGTFEGHTESIDAIADVASIVQLDFMDGIFVRSKSWPYIHEKKEEYLQVIALPHRENILYEAHLMVADPVSMITDCAKWGFGRVIVHVESFQSVDEAKVCVQKIRDTGLEIGISLMLDTSLQTIDPLVTEEGIEHVQVMTIAQVGVQGNPFDDRALERIRSIGKAYPNVTIAVDGGIKQTNVRDVVQAGATVIGVGSGILGAEDPKTAYKEFVNIVT